MKKGYGYYGCLTSTLDGTKIQCHVCGGLFGELQAHVRQAHKIDVDTYREKFQLSYSTSLVSETERERRKILTLEWVGRMKKQFGDNWREHFVARGRRAQQLRKKNQPEIRLETKNKRGTCPDQILAKITEVAKKLKKTPTLAEFIEETGGQRYKHLVFKTYGSWNNALKLLKLDLNTTGKTGPKRTRRYSNEELLEYLAIFAQEQQKLPTATDCKRGLLPDYDIYTRRFGSIEEARELAGVYNFIERKQYGQRWPQKNELATVKTAK